MTRCFRISSHCPELRFWSTFTLPCLASLRMSTVSILLCRTFWKVFVLPEALQLAVTFTGNPSFCGVEISQVLVMFDAKIRSNRSYF